MKDSAVRIESVEIRNFKNVVYGCLKTGNRKKDGKSSILGLYGQNGSGKTALIDSLELLRLVLSGRSVPARFADYINVDSEFATIKYGFSVSDLGGGRDFSVFYEVSIRRDEDESGRNIDRPPDGTGARKTKTTLFGETLSCVQECRDGRKRLTRIIDTRTDNIFAPKKSLGELVGSDRETRMELLVAKRIAHASSRSFIFSRELLEAVRKNAAENDYRFIIDSLVFFGNFELFVINTQNSGQISMNALPLTYNYTENDKVIIGELLLRLDEPSLIPTSALSVVKKVIGSMNIVLKQLVPGLTIDIKELGAQLYPDGSSGCRVQLVSNKNSREIPLQYESEGIKKLISVLQLFIVLYNKTSITVAVDELDSGIFEYLLGEILRIISEKGKGQLIFTSHNLRPLETLDKCFIAFTTTNPENRYISMRNVKSSGNLRDFYYRDIVLGEQSESVYEPTNNSEIALAFREAGVRDAT